MNHECITQNFKLSLLNTKTQLRRVPRLPHFKLVRKSGEKVSHTQTNECVVASIEANSSCDASAPIEASSCSSLFFLNILKDQGKCSCLVSFSLCEKFLWWPNTEMTGLSYLSKKTKDVKYVFL